MFDFWQKKQVWLYMLFIGFNVCIFANLYASEATYQFETGLNLSSFQYKEFSFNGNLLDREDGFLPGLFIEAKVDNYPYQYSLNFSGQQSTLDYSGRTQIGSPLETRTLETIYQYSFKIKRHLFEQPYPTYLMVEMGERHWDRDIYQTAITNSLSEIYHWPYIMMGGSIQVLNDANKNFEIQILYGKSLNATLDIYFEGFDRTTLQLESGDVLVFKMPLSIRGVAGYTLQIEPYFEYWHFDKSEKTALNINGVPSGYFANEPENETTLLGLNVSFLF
jgi:hypothetical protein